MNRPGNLKILFLALTTLILTENVQAYALQCHCRQLLNATGQHCLENANAPTPGVFISCPIAQPIEELSLLF